MTYVAAVLFGVFSISWADASDHEATLRTPVPKRWAARTANHCKPIKGSRMRMCDGPRRTPEPYGPAALEADELGLGTLEVGRKLLRERPRQEWVDAVRGAVKSTLLWPIEQGKFGRGFGYVRKERKSLRHNGVDVGAGVGELVRSLNDGIVAYSDNQIKGFGNTVVVIHKDRSVSFYCHLQASYLFAGQQVKRGQVVGEVGLTGITRGPHLHFEWHQDGDARDPMARMVGQPTRQRAGAMMDFDDSTPLSI